jgi:hypothetical protein
MAGVLGFSFQLSGFGLQASGFRLQASGFRLWANSPLAAGFVPPSPNGKDLARL